MIVLARFSKVVSISILACLLFLNIAQGGARKSQTQEPLVSSDVQVSSEPSKNLSSKRRISKCTQWAKYMKKNLGWFTTILGIGGASGVVFNEKYSSIPVEVPLQFRVSDGFSSVIRNVVLPTICIPTARVVMTKAQETQLGNWLGLHNRIDLHKWLGGLFTAAATGHSICSLVGDPQKIVETQSGRTGAVMWTAILVPLIGSYALKDVPWLQSYSYISKFLRPHQAGYLLFIGGLAFHLPGLKMIPWIMIPVGELVLDRFFEYWYYTFNTKVNDARIQGDKVILTLSKPEKMEVQPGQFVYLEMDGGYRPFTIAWSDKDSLSFVISPAGKGTRQFYEMVERGELPAESPFSIKGPYSSSFQEASKSSQLITVTGGSGVSVTTALLQGLEKNGIGRMASIVHSERNVESFFPLIESIARAQKEEVSIGAVHLFLTGQQEIDLESSAASVRLLREKVEEHGMRLIESQPATYQNMSGIDEDHKDENAGKVIQVFLHRGRLNLADSMSNESVISDLNQNHDAHVVISGNKKFTQMVKDFCTENDFDFTTEAFEF